LRLRSEFKQQHDILAVRLKKFSKVSALVYRLYKVPVELTFENVYHPPQPTGHVDCRGNRDGSTGSQRLLHELAL
jgi:hypothetical protein